MDIILFFSLYEIAVIHSLHMSKKHALDDWKCVCLHVLMLEMV